MAAPDLRTVELHLPGLRVLEHELDVPLDHTTATNTTADTTAASLVVFAREVSAVDDGRDKPALLFLQGGPGQEATRPFGAPLTSGWMARALRDFRLVLLDQRGTGRSTPVGDLPGMTPSQQADYLAHFRADSIVRDAELLREALGIERWSLLGQSFGGFCSLTYLSLAPSSLTSVHVTGGLAPIGMSPDDVYAATWAQMRVLSARYHERYPHDLERLRSLHAELAEREIRTTTGDRVTSRTLRAAGHGLGMSDGADALHALLERPVDSPAFRADIADPLGLARNPLYLLVHEACYADGFTTAWAAERTRPDDFGDPAAGGDPALLSGEHVGGWLLDPERGGVGALAPVAEAARLLADRPWPRLYDPSVLDGVARGADAVPVAAAIYLDDPYVLAEHSRATAALLGARTWITDELLHNGLRADGDRVLSRLFDMTAGRL
ncbi:Pimeloyl-ACP methyl ester carboxylesterase [Quadrisphaera granulorum]|uniref:Pimeloyl-ACP methyl ester carboxylesterase n=1 Tax=Quadrisphaera granulorum TaxID=317664 RepID=A0A315ZT38_9ACTN|nr:alpha/beta fold hydrolase [Quadrisphaera granulorum]PWJ48472.1 pimeloyl-ACP methyl ester carboxylesterase [Quadrisphaera granulorum]SZE98431.1 Pimeloyl-ACP methyl ester carboxylesterase [Quadrisphaera granulorum]